MIYNFDFLRVLLFLFIYFFSGRCNYNHAYNFLGCFLKNFIVFFPPRPRRLMKGCLGFLEELVGGCLEFLEELGRRLCVSFCVLFLEELVGGCPGFIEELVGSCLKFVSSLNLSSLNIPSLNLK